MNERIRELELEAIAYADSKVPANDRYNDIYHSIVHGKFAELIVADVVEQTKQDLMKWLEFQVYSGSSHWTDTQGSPDWLRMDEMTEYMPGTIDKIKKHFK